MTDGQSTDNAIYHKSNQTHNSSKSIHYDDRRFEDTVLAIYCVCVHKLLSLLQQMGVRTNHWRTVHRTTINQY